MLMMRYRDVSPDVADTFADNFRASRLAIPTRAFPLICNTTTKPTTKKTAIAFD